VGIVHTSQAFVQHLASKFTTLNETEHWKMNFILFMYLIISNYSSVDVILARLEAFL
jgi:hypothetical protein